MSKNFNGFSIILNKPSRFDIKNNKLLSANSGDWFAKQLGKNGIDINECHITTASNNNIPKETRTLFLLGDEALALFKPEVSIGEQRGSPFTISLPTGDINCICSFTPQDSFDPQNYEAKFNSSQSVDSNDSDDEGAAKAHGKTSRKNYKFWLTKDIAKVSRIHLSGVVNVIEPCLNIYPPQEEIISELLKHKGKDFTIDIETNPETCDITVFSFCFTDKNDFETVPEVFVVPVWLYNCTLAYDNIYKIFAALAVAMRDNTTVHHNGSGYDLFIFAYKYKIPFGINQFDTMLAHNRCHVEVEKSLGHLISLYTDFPYHKNTAGTYVTYNAEQDYALWKYNGTDVLTTLYCKRGILKYAAKIGALESIEQINRSIYPYLLMCFNGIRVDKEAMDNHILQNDRRINQLLRILKILVGRVINPRSSKDMPHYLYGKKTEGGLGLTPPFYTKEGSPACDAKAIINLILKHPMLATLRVILEIRRTQDESKALIFKPICW